MEFISSTAAQTVIATRDVLLFKGKALSAIAPMQTVDQKPWQALY